MKKELKCLVMISNDTRITKITTHQPALQPSAQATTVTL